MRLPSAKKQLAILSEAVDKLAQWPDEEKKVEVIFDAFEKLGLSGDIRYRISVLVAEKNVLSMKYLRGNYGGLNLQGARYNLSGSEAVKSAVEKESPVTADAQSLEQKPQSMMVLPLIANGKVIGVLSFDSLIERDFSEAIARVLIPYAYLLSINLNIATPTNQQADVISYISQSRKKQVLILGKDTGEELQRLIDICDLTREFGYEPLLVKDYPDIPELSNEEKVRVFADASRFVILENSFPAGQIAELKMCSTNRIVTASLREKGKGSSFMVTDYFKDYDFMEEFVYELDSIQLILKKALDWAEKKIQERIHYYDNLYPWRKSEPKNP
jgi:hypothetical protein